MKRKIHRTAKEEPDPIKEAYRYLSNAKEILSRIPIEYGIYKDSKYVSMAAETAYIGALKAIDHYLLKKRNFNRDKLPNSYDGYRDAIQKYILLNGKLSSALTVAWQNLHVLGHYRGGVDKVMIKSGLENAERIIKMMDV
ncbi:MAG: DUF5618 family protein [Chitinophagales bacterium]